GERREQLPGFLLLALLDERQRGHLAGRAEPRIARLGERLHPADHLLRLELIELERGFADQRRIAVRVGKPAIVADLLIKRDRGFLIILLEGEGGAREQRGRSDALAS